MSTLDGHLKFAFGSRVRQWLVVVSHCSAWLGVYGDGSLWHPPVGRQVRRRLVLRIHAED